MARHRIRKRPMAEIKVEPYIDLMLVMLVIFMITAPLLTQGVQVDLPSADAEVMPPDEKEPVVLSVDAGGELYLNIGKSPDQPLDQESLVQHVAAVLRNNPGTPVLIRGDASVDYGTVVSAMVLLQEAGVPNVGLITESPESDE